MHQQLSRAHIFMTRTDPYQSQQTRNPTCTCNPSNILARTRPSPYNGSFYFASRKATYTLLALFCLYKIFLDLGTALDIIFIRAGSGLRLSKMDLKTCYTFHSVSNVFQRNIIFIETLSKMTNGVMYLVL